MLLLLMMMLMMKLIIDVQMVGLVLVLVVVMRLQRPAVVRFDARFERWLIVVIGNHAGGWWLMGFLGGHHEMRGTLRTKFNVRITTKEDGKIMYRLLPVLPGIGSHSDRCSLSSLPISHHSDSPGTNPIRIRCSADSDRRCCTNVALDWNSWTRC